MISYVIVLVIHISRVLVKNSGDKLKRASCFHYEQRQMPKAQWQFQIIPNQYVELPITIILFLFIEQDKRVSVLPLVHLSSGITQEDTWPKTIFFEDHK